MPGGLKSPVTPIWRSCRPRMFACGVLSPLGPWIAAAGRRQTTPPFRPPDPSPGGSEVCRWPRCGAPQRPALGLRGRAVGAAAHARSATCRRPSAGRPAADCTTPRRCKVAGADGSATNEMPSERAGQPRPGAARTRRGTRGASQGNLRARLRHCGFSPSPSCRSSRLPRRWTRRRPHQTLRSAADGARWEQQPRRRCPQRGAGGAGAPARTALGAGSGLPRARGESSARPAARPSASAGSCLLPAGSQASRKAPADCA